jgi:hypothetical protein
MMNANANNVKQHEPMMVRANLRSFLLLTDQWGLSRKEANALIGLSGLHSMAYWQSKPDDVALTEYQVERLSYVLAICKMLDNAFEHAAVHRWLHQSNALPVFRDQPPLSRLCDGNLSELKKIATYLLASDELSR